MPAAIVYYRIEPATQGQFPRKILPLSNRTQRIMQENERGRELLLHDFHALHPQTILHDYKVPVE